MNHPNRNARKQSVVFPVPDKIFYSDEVNALVIVMVGLPARGKTYIGQKLSRYLNWSGAKTRVFNVGDYRRRATDIAIHDFFRKDNAEAVAIRDKAAFDALEDMMNWIRDGGEIAVFDATNVTRDRRELVLNHCIKNELVPFFVESVCDDQKIIERNVYEVKINSPDYIGTDKKEAVRDFLKRIDHYNEQYEPLDPEFDKDISFLKIYNQGDKYLANRILGNIQSRVVYYLMNMIVAQRTIYICRHGESEYNRSGQIGGDSGLTPAGEEFARKLREFITAQDTNGLRVWTSHLKRCRQTAIGIKEAGLHVEQWKALSEIDAGECDGLTYEEIKAQYPIEIARRLKDKFRYRYPLGESYGDVIVRLEPVIMELERQQNVLVVCHQAVARCLLAYFQNKSLQELPYLQVPLHTVIKLTPIAYGCRVEEIPFDIDAVDAGEAAWDNALPCHAEDISLDEPSEADVASVFNEDDKTP